MRVGAIIFSRMSSERLPGKAMMDISGKTLLNRVIERTKCVKLIDHICLATSTNPEDDIIESAANSFGIDVFRGSLNDVTTRAVEASNHFNYDSFLRLCGDRPFLDGNIYNDLIAIHKKNQCDITTNIFPRTVPPGLTGEVIKLEALKKSLSLTDNHIDREHVTRYIYKNPSKFSITNIDCFTNKDLIKLRLVVDDEIDLNRSRWITKKLNERKCEFNTMEIIDLAKEWEKNKFKQV